MPYPTGDLSDKTVIATGSNVGLGKGAARHFARLGASRLILAGNLDKGGPAKEDIEATTNKNVIQFAGRVESDLDRVDIFVANAGVAPSKYGTAEDNEEMITVNVFSTFLLLALVLPNSRRRLPNTRRAPLAITSSGIHAKTQFPPRSAPEGQIFARSTTGRRPRSTGASSTLSRSCSIFVVRSIGERHPASEFSVTINCLNPGLCRSELARDRPSLAFTIFNMLIARSTEVGSHTLIHTAMAGAETHGQNCRTVRLRPVRAGAFQGGSAGSQTRNT
ncbi:hypothetical protein V1509DRAFT_658928 [Lipomyces kononenkoae]